MATELVLVRDRDHLVARTAYDAEQMQRIATGVDVMAKLWVPRSIKRHKLVWALAGMVARQHRYLRTAEQVMQRAKLMAHMGTLTSGYDPERGKPIDIFIPKSLSFATMDEMEFATHFEPLLDAMASMIGVDRETLMAESAKEML